MGLAGGLIFAAIAIAAGTVLIVFRRRLWELNAAALRTIFGRAGDWVLAGGSPVTYAIVGSGAIAMGAFVLVVSILLFTGVIVSPE